VNWLCYVYAFGRRFYPKRLKLISQVGRRGERVLPKDPTGGSTFPAGVSGPVLHEQTEGFCSPGGLISI